ncbi:hypothetical protein VPHK469_0117 [Vibrio phage K469]
MKRTIVLAAMLATASVQAADEWSIEMHADVADFSAVRERLEDFNTCKGYAYAQRVGSGMIYTDEIKIRCYPKGLKPETSFWSAYDVPMRHTMSEVFHRANRCTADGGKPTIRQGKGGWTPDFIITCGSR